MLGYCHFRAIRPESRKSSRVKELQSLVKIKNQVDLNVGYLPVINSPICIYSIIKMDFDHDNQIDEPVANDNNMSRTVLWLRYIIEPPK